MWLRVSLIRFALSAATFFFTSGCGGEEKGPSSAVVKPSLGIPQGFFLESESCQERGTGLGVLGEPSLTLWSDGRLKTNKVDFTGITSSPSLGSKVISGVYHGVAESVLKECRTTVESECTFKVLDQDEGKLLKICDASAAFARNSVEAAGLASVYGLSKAARYYEFLPEEIKMPLPKSRVIVLPLFEIQESQPGDREKIIKRVRTDNAAWINSGGLNFEFYIFPTGKTSRNLSPLQPNYWEIPFVLSHEFGHHVFFQHYKNFNADMEITAFKSEGNILRSVAEGERRDEWYNGDGFSQRFVKVNSLLSQATETRVVNNREVLRALNEGFADLYGFYANGSAPDLLKNVKCLSSSRDVLRASFMKSGNTGRDVPDGTPPQIVVAKKDLSDSAVNRFFSYVTEAEPEDCEIPSFQDVHAIGAIFAHFFNDLIAERFPDVNTTERLQALLLWVKNLDAARHDADGKPVFINPQGFLKLGLKEAIKVTTKDGKTLSQTQCEKIRNSVSAYAAEFLAGSAPQFTCKP